MLFSVLSPYYPNAIAKAVAFFLLISSPSVPELMFELIKYRPVPPPPAVLLYNFVTAVALGVLAAPENVIVSLITTSPVPFALKIRSPFDDPVSIELTLTKFCAKVSAIVSGSDPAVFMLLSPVN